MEISDKNTNQELLEVVNDNEEVINIEERKKIHQQGLYHKEIHVWFYTPNGEIIFQHRAKNKETYPDLLDATVGGHVSIGDSYIETAIRETKEETGVDINSEDLIPLIKLKTNSYDEFTKLRNNKFTMQFAYCYKGIIEDLKVERNQGIGFETWSINDLFTLSSEIKRRFISGIINSKDFLNIFREIKKLI